MIGPIDSDLFNSFLNYLNFRIISEMSHQGQIDFTFNIQTYFVPKKIY